MPRLRKKDADKKRQRKIYTTDADHARHLRHAEESGLSYSDYMNMRGLKQPVRSRPALSPEVHVTLEAIFREFRRTASDVARHEEGLTGIRCLESLNRIETMLLACLPELTLKPDRNEAPE